MNHTARLPNEMKGMIFYFESHVLFWKRKFRDKLITFRHAKPKVRSFYTQQSLHLKKRIILSSIPPNPLLLHHHHHHHLLPLPLPRRCGWTTVCLSVCVSIMSFCMIVKDILTKGMVFA